MEKFFVAGIGASSGGLRALLDFFGHLRPNLPVAWVVVTHLLRSARSNLDKTLQQQTRMEVIRVDTDVLLEPGKVYVLAENLSMKVEGQMLKVYPRGEEVINHSVNIFLNSLALSHGDQALSIILSGNGKDGLDGSNAVFSRGGLVLAQDPDTASFPSMPTAVINHDHPSKVLSPGDLAEHLNEICK